MNPFAGAIRSVFGDQRPADDGHRGWLFALLTMAAQSFDDAQNNVHSTPCAETVRRVRATLGDTQVSREVAAQLNTAVTRETRGY